LRPLRASVRLPELPEGIEQMAAKIAKKQEEGCFVTQFVLEFNSVQLR
jgi:hypothetical protein